MLKSFQQNFSKTSYSKVLELKKYLASNNFQEVINYSFVDDGLQNELELSKGLIKIQNPNWISVVGGGGAEPLLRLGEGLAPPPEQLPDSRLVFLSTTIHDQD